MTARYIDIIVRVHAEEGITPDLAQREVAIAIDEHIDTGRAKVSFASIGISTPWKEGWIEWGGGKQPVPDGVLVDVELRCGEVLDHYWPEGLNWGSTQANGAWGGPRDIVRYRLAGGNHT